MVSTGFTYLALSVASAAITAGAAVVVGSRRRGAPGATAYLFVLIAQAVWAFGSVGELSSRTLPGKIFWDDVQLPPVYILSGALLAFALEYTGRKLPGGRRTVALLAVVPVLACAWVLGDPIHGLARGSARILDDGPFGALVYDFSTIESVSWLEVYGVMLVAITLLVAHASDQNRFFRLQVSAVVIGAALPMLGGLFSLAGIHILGQRDTAPLSFGVSGLRGTLRIEASNQRIDGPRIEKTGRQAGEFVVLSVRDSGTGMTAGELGRIFEPFYTSKDVGKGTGLGLPVVSGVVEQHDGFIEVDSEPDKGSTFRIALPRARIASEEAEAVSRLEETLPRGTEVIALVEDQPLLRDLVGRVLTPLGYEVLAFASAEQALTSLGSFAGSLGLLLTDVVLPGMSGRELAKLLREARPGLPVLFSSGYTEDVLIRHGLEQGSVRFIGKPFTAGTLAVAVRAAIDDRT